MAKDYELIIKDDAYSVFVQGNEYFLSKENEDTLPLVTNQKNSLLVKINLTEMLQNLINCTNLLDVVYCSVAGIGTLPGKVSRLQKSLLQNISDSELTMSGFVSTTSSVLSDLTEVYPLFSDSAYDDAVSILTAVKEHAKRMMTDAIKVRDAFQTRCDETDAILQDTFSNNQMLLDKKDKVSEEIADMNAELEAFTVLEKILEEQITDMNNEYQALVKKEEKAADRAFSLELTGAITGALGELIQTILPIKDILSGFSPDTPSSEEEKQNTENACSDSESADIDVSENEEIQKTVQKTENLKQNRTVLEQEIHTLQQELQDPNRNDFEEKRTVLEEKQKELDNLNQNIKTQEKTIEKVSSALKAAGSSFTNAAEHQQSTVEAYNKRLEKIFKLKQEMTKQNAENKAKIAAYKAKIASSIQNNKDLNIAIQSLTMAIGSMRRIIVILNETVLFWKSIVICCETLDQSDFIDSVRKSQEQIEDTDKPLFYTKRLFIKPFLAYFIQWQALRLISEEYVENMYLARKNLENAMSESEGTREEQWKKAALKAQDLQI